MTISYQHVAPSAEQFRAFRNGCGWGEIDLSVAKEALTGSLHVISSFDGDELIGFVRAVGDGSLNIYIQDLIVIETHQGRHIGRQLLSEIMAFVAENYPRADVGLMSAKGVEPFYEAAGFITRPTEKFGAGMMKFGAL